MSHASPQEFLRELFAWKKEPLSHVRFFATCQAPLSLGFSRQEYWSGLPCPPADYLPKPGLEPGSPVLQADSLSSEPCLLPKYMSFYYRARLWVCACVEGVKDGKCGHQASSCWCTWVNRWPERVTSVDLKAGGWGIESMWEPSSYTGRIWGAHRDD